VSAPLLGRNREEIDECLRASRDARSVIALVPTMGALHEGHVALIRRARELADVVVVSIFVNPLQFGPDEDLSRYPRDLDADLAICAREDVDVVLAPSVETMYPDGPLVTVTGGAMAASFEGASRPGHFDGVLTVVAKLFNLVDPDLAVFGEKDAQQLALIRRMVRDLSYRTRVEAQPLVRDADGLALSSRNQYLGDQRVNALALSRALAAASSTASAGAPASAVRAAALAALQSESAILVDYVELVSDSDFAAVPDNHEGPVRLILAARVGSTRLIDNAVMTIASRSDSVGAHA
jgi:pantoate--beta-alanine ligase